MKLQAKLFISASTLILAVCARAAITAGAGYQSETYYANPHEDAILVSFDWDSETNLYYSTGSPYWDLGFAVYRYDGVALTAIYENAAVFAGSRVTAIGDRIYFNDGGTYERWTYNYYIHNPGSSGVLDLGVASDLWGLETRDHSDFWAAGGISAAIYYSLLDDNGALISNPLINLGAIGSASGPLAFDSNGNLFYAEGYNTAGANVYRWSAAAIAAAIANPTNAPLSPTNHLFTTLLAGDGSTAMAVDADGHPIVTATSFTAPSELHRLLVYHNIYIGYEAIARSDERLSALRLRDGRIYVGSGSGVFAIAPEKALHLALQDSASSAIMFFALNDQGHTLGVNTIASSSQGWQVRGLDSNRLLVQQGDGGAVAVAMLGAAHTVTGVAVIAQSAPGWIARALDGNNLLVQASNGGAIGIIQLGANYSPGHFTLVTESAPGIIARDLDGNRLLVQQGDGGAVYIAELDASGAPTNVNRVCGAIPNWAARALCGNLLLVQNTSSGYCIVTELAEDDTPSGYHRLVLNPLGSIAAVGLDLE